MKKNKLIKIKDLPKDINLAGCKLNGKVIISGWNKGFWVRKDPQSSQMFPVFFDNWEQVKEWKVELPTI